MSTLKVPPTRKNAEGRMGCPVTVREEFQKVAPRQVSKPLKKISAHAGDMGGGVSAIVEALT
jgi:hypothetical protein